MKNRKGQPMSGLPFFCNVCFSGKHARKHCMKTQPWSGFHYMQSMRVRVNPHTHGLHMRREKIHSRSVTSIVNGFIPMSFFLSV